MDDCTEKSTLGGDRTYKLGSGTTSEPGRYVKSLGDPVTGLSATSKKRNTYEVLVGKNDAEHVKGELRRFFKNYKIQARFI
jgi:hypothetical protein